MTRAKNYDSHFAAKREMAKTTDNSNMSEDIETKQLITTAPSRRNKRKFFQQMTLPIVAFGGFLLLSAAFFGGVVQAGSNQPCSAPCIPGTEEIMSRKEHGTSHTPVQENLRWKCDRDTADRICNFNRVSSRCQYARSQTSTAHPYLHANCSTTRNIRDIGKRQHSLTI